jgi:P27 family predicted phage terminase small subunit
MVVTSCDPPSWLDDEARVEFERLAGGCDLDEVERANLAAYAFALTCWKRARDVVDLVHHSPVRTWVGPDGQERPHPAYMVESRLAEELADLAEAVGVNPPTRRRLTPTRIWLLDEGF